MKEVQYQLDLLKAMNQNISAKERMYRLICEKSDGAFLYLSADREEVHTLGRWKDNFDFDITEKRELEKLFEAVDEAYSIPLREVVFLEKNSQKPEQESVECLTRDKKRWLRFRTNLIYDGDGACTDKIIGIFDITKYKRQSEELAYYFYYDIYTGLYNRNYFIRLLGDFLHKAEKEKETVSVMMLDVDDFHKINDSLGMIAGDEVIQQLGAVIKELCNDRIIACHFHSDVYCIAVFGQSGGYTVEKVQSALDERISKPFQVGGGQSVNVTVTMGVARYPEASDNAIGLIGCAEVVMLKCKSMGKGSILYYEAPILNDFLTSVELETKLKGALTDNGFELYFQPQFYTGNKKLRGMETLLRWRDTDGRLISPGMFIPIAEKNGFIIPLGNWVIENAVAQYAKWRDIYGTDFILSINVSAKQYIHPDFVDHFLEVLEKYQVNPYQIELEVTESILIEDFEAVCEKLRFLQGKGVRISLDDFGTGYSSLSYLKKLPINTLKIDKSFIDTVLSDSPTRIITESIINMIKSLGYESVAEGVEQEQQYQYLHAVGCDVIQGFYLGRPLCVPDAEKLLQDETVR